MGHQSKLKHNFEDLLVPCLLRCCFSLMTQVALHSINTQKIHFGKTRISSLDEGLYELPSELKRYIQLVTYFCWFM